MTGINSKDRIPMVAAIVVIVLGNVVGYSLRFTIFMSILAAPLAIAAFVVVRYALYGEALPDAVSRNR